MSVSAGLRSGPAAFKDSAPARSSIRSVPRSLAHVVCCRRRRRWRGHLSRQNQGTRTDKTSKAQAKRLRVKVREAVMLEKKWH
ncbi:uncharacterized protein FFB20_14763 [Fusarium fujikuroi]|uniref:Uncharacterized protein n=1 Tax=Fusarium fujikuroi TaxID=5127 RepID=A0A9Q9U6U8_FUSFU|nr:uncharacterized protein FFB20_14763 [Fusarium fujikuroi]VTT62419.1 unnamed protein product [Fusarium fujikuroi]VZH90814.1 unnamed protein product [Fusarium fujikuroi]